MYLQNITEDINSIDRSIFTFFSSTSRDLINIKGSH